MSKPAARTGRVFKTAAFSKKAKKAHIKDDELCAAIEQVMQGQTADLGEGVFKKRLNENMHRSIVLAKGGKIWVYEYLFAKKARENIDDDELEAFRKLAKAYEALTSQQIEQLVHGGDFLEICDGKENKIQK